MQLVASMGDLSHLTYTPRGYNLLSMNSTWRTAISATLHCLTGCAIGEVLGMVLATWWGWGDASSIGLSVGLAFFFGYLLTFVGVRRAGADVSTAVRLALASDTISIAVMEMVDNGFIVAVPGAMEATLTSWLFWVSLVVSLAIAFAVAVPVNRWLIMRGKGHAVVHELHHAGHAGHADHGDHAGQGAQGGHHDHLGHAGH